MEQQPDALRMSHGLKHDKSESPYLREVAAELERLHAQVKHLQADANTCGSGTGCLYKDALIESLQEAQFEEKRRLGIQADAVAQADRRVVELLQQVERLQAEQGRVAADDVLTDIVRQFISIDERLAANLGEMMREAGIYSISITSKHGELMIENEALVAKARAALAAQPQRVALTDAEIVYIAEDSGLTGPLSRVGNLHTRIVPFTRAIEAAHGITPGAGGA